MYFGDYHTHTTYSHGTGSIEENVLAAKKAGLRAVAITDHGFGHVAYGVKRGKWEEMRAETERLKKLYPDMEILLGLECNLISLDGDMDLREDEIEKMDIIVCGYHKLAWPKNIGQAFGFAIPNLTYSATKLSSRKRKVKNTDAYIKLVEKYPIDIVSHINFAIDSDAVEVAKACKFYGTMVELNGKRVNFTDSEIEEMVQADVDFIVDSDAHKPVAVGRFDTPEKIIERLHIPESRLVNFEKKPRFRSRKN